MSRPIASLHCYTASLRLLLRNHARGSCCLARSYSSRRTKQTTSTSSDPRRNVRYPYVQGDPLHEDAIKNHKKKTFLTQLKDKDKNTDSRKMSFLKQQTNVFETEGGLKYERLMEGDIRLGRTILVAKSSQSNPAGDDTILLEGERLITDALLLGAQAKSLYFCEPKVLNNLPSHLIRRDDLGLYKIVYKDMKIWSDAVTPPGILGVFKKPHEGEAVSPAEPALPVTLILDSLKDPGNVGTLIRTAAAIGSHQVIATKGTANVWDCKVLRSAMGGHFSVPIYSGVSWTDIPNLLHGKAQVFLANTRQASVLASSFDGSLRTEDLDRALEESDESDSDSETDSPDGQQFTESRSTRHQFVGRNSSQFLEKKSSANFQRVPLAICDYSDIVLNLPSSGSSVPSVALVLGGETEGLSTQAKKFAYTHYGQYVSIPMVQTVNSLNTGIAGSIILYELRRKLLQVGLRADTNK